MREILFRGKRADNGEWVEGSLQKYTHEKPNGVETHYNISEYNYGYADNDGFEPTYTSGFDDEVIPETVGQYTGLTDKNGKRIFEGDIVEHHAQGDIIVNRGVVVWDAPNGRWAYQLNTMCPCFYMHDPKAVEVIDNIYDNPELIGKDDTND